MARYQYESILPSLGCTSALFSTNVICPVIPFVMLA
jgi:hypothetical protein